MVEVTQLLKIHNVNKCNTVFSLHVTCKNPADMLEYTTENRTEKSPAQKQRAQGADARFAIARG